MSKITIPTYLSVCTDASAFETNTRLYEPGYQGKFYEIELSIIDRDILSIVIPNFANVKVGKASKIISLSFRYCGETASIIPQYSDPMMNVMGCCACCNGLCVYGASECSCQSFPK